MKLASGFCIPEPLPMHTGIKGRQVHPLIRFYAEEPRRVPGNQRWFKIVAWGHNISVPSIRERGLRTQPRRSLSVGHYELCRDDIGVLWKAPQAEPRHNLVACRC